MQFIYIVNPEDRSYFTRLIDEEICAGYENSPLPHQGLALDSKEFSIQKTSKLLPYLAPSVPIAQRTWPV